MKFAHLRPTLLLAALLLATLALSAQNSPRIQQLKRERAALQQRIKQSEELLTTTRRSVTAQLSQLSLLDARIAEQEAFVNSVQAEVTALSTAIAQLQREQQQLARDLAQCKEKYRRALLYMNRNRLMQNRWAFILMSKDFRQMYRRMRYASEYSAHLRAQGEVIKEKEAALQAKQRELDAAKAEKAQLLAAAQQERAALDEQKKQRQAAVDELKGKQQQIQRSLRQTRRQQANLNARIEKLIQEEIAAAERRRKEEEARKKREAERRRREAARRGGSSGSGGATGGSSAEPRFEESAADRALAGSFANNRGRLPVPVTGSYAITSRYGQYRVDGLRDVQLDNKGINITARPGAKARCVFDGEVSAVASLSGTYIVIVRHGTYYSVYSNLSGVNVRQGQKVKARQTIGTPASDGAGNVMLHFQLRQKSGRSASPVNPLPWLAR